MGKKQNIIEINGQRYDAHTGTALDHGHHQPVVAPAATSVTIKPTVIKPTPAQPKKTAGHHRAGRQAAKHAARHKPQRSTTLVRRSVRRPSSSLKRRVKVQGNTGALTEQPSAEVYRTPSFGLPNDKRTARASRVKKSDLIAHFNPNQPNYPNYEVKVTVAKPAKPPATAAKTVQRQPAPAIDDIFERAIQQATSHLQPAPKKPRKRRLRISRKHARA